MNLEYKKIEYNELTALQLKFISKNSHFMWWEEPEKAIQNPHKIIAQIMRLGNLNLIKELISNFNNNILIRVLKNARPGEFDIYSWHYWHYKLLNLSLGEVPDIPIRECLNREDFDPKFFYGINY